MTFMLQCGLGRQCNGSMSSSHDPCCVFLLPWQCDTIASPCTLLLLHFGIDICGQSQCFAAAVYNNCSAFTNADAELGIESQQAALSSRPVLGSSQNAVNPAQTSFLR